MLSRLLFIICLIALFAAPAFAEDAASVLAQFEQPGREYSPGPLWVWNDMLTEEQVVTSLREMAEQGIRQPFVHPRPGLMTPYLGEDWFKLWKAALAEAERLDLSIWIYDENSYPSGFAGGWVPELMPESRGKGVNIHKEKNPGAVTDATLAIFLLEDKQYTDITSAVREGKTFPEGEYVVAEITQAGTSPWFADRSYVDLLKPGVTEKFLELTLDAYKRELGDQLGKRIPGSFTDEPHLAPAAGLHWTDDLPAQFEQRWGYSLLESLPCLTEPVGDWKRVRHNYYQTLLDLFIERWAKPYVEYCARNNIEFTGHYWEHEWPNTRSAPDNMAMGAWQQRPGIDILFNQYDEGPHAQFGNVRAVLELGSVANQMGLKRTLCETYGAGGWDLRFEDMKRIGDWIYVLGVNTMNEHIANITIRGARKADHPQVFSYHEPWWNAYHVMTRYFTRLSLALSSGEQINRILVIEPTTTAWMYQGAGGQADRLGTTFQRLVTDLAQAQVEFDIGCEDIIARNGSVDGKGLVVGQRRYDTVVLHESNENLNTATLALLEEYAKNGGRLVASGDTNIAFVDGVESRRGRTLAKGWVKQTPEATAAYLLSLAEGGFAVRRAEGDTGLLYHHRRQLADGDLLFISNTSIDAPAAGVVETPMAGVTAWNLDTGKTEPYAFTSAGGVTRAEFSLPPCGSLLLFLSKAACAPGTPPAATGTAVAAKDSIKIEPVDLNVLTLDYLDITAGGETKQGLYHMHAAPFAFQKNGMERNPWSTAVQFKDELISKTFPPDSGFEASYRFTIEGGVPKSLFIVIESAGRYAVTCNGKPVAAKDGAWWLDKAFGKIDIATEAVPGENVVTITAKPFTIFHEVAAAYVLGDFTVKPAEKGFVIAPAGTLALGPWKQQGWPLYAAGMRYSQTFEVAAVSGRYFVTIPDWYGSVARVEVNGKDAGYVYRRPTECEVTGLLAPGGNTITVTVIGTLKNTLGPFHENPGLGIASPGHFAKGPELGPPAGAEYSTVDYGLYAPFTLEQR